MCSISEKKAFNYYNLMEPLNKSIEKFKWKKMHLEIKRIS